ncbi:MAG: hypothetical protein ACI4MH_03215 [Candidatus Coproplasma sp.]
MWNENAPLALLKELPAELNQANLARIQQVIDFDKFINSSECGYDLCGSYAPFCQGCDKGVNYPCAVAYVKMMQAQGMEISIAEENSSSEQPEEVAEEQSVETAAEHPEEAVEEQPEEQPPVDAEQPKKLIRIAIARRKSN